MRTSVRSNGGREASARDKVVEQTKGLIRQLSMQSAAGEDPALALQQASDCEEVIVDVEVDGARYLLIRMPTATRSLVTLSPREQEIVRMVAKDHANKTIAGVLNISSWTVRTHLRRIFAKLGVASRAAMVARLVEEGRAWNPSQLDEKPIANETYASTTNTPPPSDARGLPRALS